MHGGFFLHDTYNLSPSTKHIVSSPFQESVQLAYGNNFERGMTGLDRNNSVSAPIHLQLYNRNSNKHLRIQERDIDAMGEDGEAYGKIFTVYFGFFTCKLNKHCY